MKNKNENEEKEQRRRKRRRNYCGCQGYKETANGEGKIF